MDQMEAGADPGAAGDLKQPEPAAPSEPLTVGQADGPQEEPGADTEPEASITTETPSRSTSSWHAPVERVAMWWSAATPIRRGAAGAIGGVLILALVGGLVVAAGRPPASASSPTPIAAGSPTQPASAGSPSELPSGVPLTGAAPCEAAFVAAPYSPSPTQTAAATPTAAPTETATPTEAPTDTPPPTATDTATPEPAGTPTAAPTDTASPADAGILAGAEFDAKPPAVAVTAPAASWLPGSAARILQAPDHDILAVPGGYLATLRFDKGYALCWSPDLLVWYSPGADKVRNTSGSTFYPVGAVPVKKGYGAAVVGDPATFGGYSDVRYDAWYSADGISWSLGIPSSVRADPPTLGDYPCSPALYGGTCLYDGSLLGWMDGIAISTNGGKAFSTPVFPSSVMFGDFWSIVRLPDKTFVAWAEVSPAGWQPTTDGHSVTAEPPREDVLMKSKNGVVWTLVTSQDAGSIFATSDGLLLINQNGLWSSKDDCATWTLVDPGISNGRFMRAGTRPVIVASAAGDITSVRIVAIQQ
ncbi:MAG TPA: hypothetical protein VF337_00250 [Candidatus Limnocylindrales bacterium]